MNLNEVNTAELKVPGLQGSGASPARSARGVLAGCCWFQKGPLASPEGPVLHPTPLMGSVLILAFILGSIGVYLSYALEPRYQGKTVRELFQDLQSLDPPLQTAAQIGLRQAGAAALPTIIDLLQVRDNWLKSKCLELETKQSLFKFPFRLGSEMRAQAFEACRLLGPDAKEVLPYLEQLINVDPGAVGVMGTLGGSAVYAISQLTDHPNRSVRLNAIEALGSFRNRPLKSLPALLHSLSRKEPEIRFFTLKALGALGAEPQRTVPALVPYLNDNVPSVRRIAAEAIGKFGPAALPALPNLLDTLLDQNPNVRRAAALASCQVDRVAALAALKEIFFEHPGGEWVARVLIKIEPEGPELLLSAVTNRLPQIRGRGYFALSLIPAGEEGLVARFVPGLSDEDLGVRRNAARSLAAHGCAPEAAIPWLSRLLEEEDVEVKYWALSVLRHAGSRARPAESTVRRLLEDDNPVIRAASASVLKSLERSPSSPRTRPVELAEWPAIFRDGPARNAEFKMQNSELRRN